MNIIKCYTENQNMIILTIGVHKIMYEYDSKPSSKKWPGEVNCDS